MNMVEKISFKAECLVFGDCRMRFAQLWISHQWTD